MLIKLFCSLQVALFSFQSSAPILELGAAIKHWLSVQAVTQHFGNLVGKECCEESLEAGSSLRS